jgi:hippurate hydrolase
MTIPSKQTRIVLRAVVLAAVLTVAPASAPAQPGSASAGAVPALVAQELPDLLQLYEQLHANPELSLREKRTSARIAEELSRLGFAVTQRVGGYGVVGVLRNGAGPVVLVRTDMDALPVTEGTGLPYASTVRARDEQGREVGVMHACGHDAHMTVLLGSARVLAAVRDRWHGTLVMIGQPAEERGLGAKGMLDDGLFTRFPRPDFCVAEHVTPSLAAGQVGVVEGYAFANVDSVDVTIRGLGGHGASPNKTKDPVVMAAQFVNALQTIVSRRIDPVDPAVVTVGSIHGGTAYNIIPDEVRLQLTVRSYAPEVRRQIIEEIERIARGVAESAGVPADRMPTVKLAEGFTPALYNDPALTRRLAAALRQALGEANVVVLKPEMVGEDFAAYGLADPRIPICMFRLGTSDPEAIRESEHGGPLPGLHSSRYAPMPGPTIRTGVTAMSTAVLDLLALVRGALAADAPPAFVKVALETGKVASGSAAVVKDVLAGEVPGIRASLISLGPGGRHVEGRSNAEDKVYLVLEGRGAVVADGAPLAVERQTIVRLPVGSDAELAAAASSILDVLVLRHALSDEDRVDLAAHPENQASPYVRKFSECPTYGEAIKSAKTTSRTLLPKDIVPRMSIGTVESAGPDRVAPHAHPMLEQFFLGLDGNDIVVHADGGQTALGANELLHIPLGSRHGADVAEGKKLHYVWMDFFRDREGLRWLETHKPNEPAKQP